MVLAMFNRVMEAGRIAKKTACSLLVLVAVLLAPACRQQAGTVIAVVPKGQAHVFWQSVHAGAAAAGRDLGVAIEWNGPATETEYSKQIEIVENFISAVWTASCWPPRSAWPWWE